MGRIKGVAAPKSSRRNAARTVSEQLTQFCNERGILKKDVAAHMGVEPAYLAQLVARGATIERLEQMAEAINILDKSKLPPIKPWHFDRYAIAMIADALNNDLGLLDVIRTAVFEMTDAERHLWQRMTLATRDT